MLFCHGNGFRSFLLLSALLHRNVASISKSRGTKLPVGDLHIYNTNRTAVIQSFSPTNIKVRGHLVKIDADSLNTFLETPVVLAEGETLPVYSIYYRLPTDIREIEVALCIPGRGFVLNAKGHPGKILRKDLTTLAQVWSVLSYSNLAPTSHTSDLMSNSSRLGFPALITALCQSRGVASDSLVFKCLSPVINLAYIRKNCWNPDDLTVTIRGARRARTRPAEAPSTSTAPPPARTLAALSALTSADFQRLEAMLQSIHQGRKKADQTQEAAATSEKSLEATFEPSEPVADIASLQQAADPSTPED
ncbi:hypothetical protein HKD37_18G050745 [Glycine soja]